MAIYTPQHRFAQTSDRDCLSVAACPRLPRGVVGSKGANVRPREPNHRLLTIVDIVDSMQPTCRMGPGKDGNTEPLPRLAASSGRCGTSAHVCGSQSPAVPVGSLFQRCA